MVSKSPVQDSSAAEAAFANALVDRNVLLVEDEAIISFLVEDMLKDLGSAEVRVANSVAEALRLLDQHRPHVAILDVQLRGEVSYPIATRLTELNVPFLFASGYGSGGVQGIWKNHKSIQKPFMIEDLAAALLETLAASARGSAAAVDKPV